MQQQPITAEIIVLYDGDCETCVKDRNRYQAWLTPAQQSNVYWANINEIEMQFLLHRYQLSYQQVLTTLHVIYQGRLLHTLDAYIVLLKQVWWLKPVALLLSLPMIKPLLTRYYLNRVKQRLEHSKRL